MLKEHHLIQMPVEMTAARLLTVVMIHRQGSVQSDVHPR